MPLITRQDFLDVYQKLHQRGGKFLLSKLNPKAIERTKSAFDETAYGSANWWIVPRVKARWNEMITGDPDKSYEQHTVEKHLAGREGLRMLSIGSGVCSHEIEFAASGVFASVVCVDVVPELLAKGKAEAERRGVKNMDFRTADIRSADLGSAAYDVVLFHASLHHFSGIDTLLRQKVKGWLRPGGKLVINEYVGADRLQYGREQIAVINQALKLLPESHRRQLGTNRLKHRYHGVGYLRMVIADPSECVESSQIMPVLHRSFRTVEERAYGGNILMACLKDIAHHFVEDSPENEALLQRLFELEDRFLAGHPSDFIYGVYEPLG